MKIYIKRDQLGHNIYEKSEGNTIKEFNRETFREYDEKNRLVKATDILPNGEKNIYTNEYKESVDEKGEICKHHTYCMNGKEKHKTKEVIDSNGIKRYYISYMYNDDLNKWYIGDIKEFNEKGLEIYSKSANEEETYIEEKHEYDKDGKVIYYINILKGDWYRKEYDDKGHVIKEIKNNDFEETSEYDKDGRLIYRKNTKGFESKISTIEIDGIKYERETFGYPEKEEYPSITIIDTPITEKSIIPKIMATERFKIKEFKILKKLSLNKEKYKRLLELRKQQEIMLFNIIKMTNGLYNKNETSKSVNVIIDELGINCNRAYYILNKWTDRGMYNWGVNVFCGWLEKEEYTIK